MNNVVEKKPGEASDMAREIAHLKHQSVQARATLAGLQQDVADAELWLSSRQASQLLEANQQLVLAMLCAQADAQTASQALTDISRIAEFDGLTKLPNRVLLLDRLNQAIAQAKRDGTCLAVMFLDLDNFKQINDKLGHGVGDEALKTAAQCLLSAVRNVDTVSRHGGDEFLILLAGLSHRSDAARVADKVIMALGAEHQIGAHALSLATSIGISFYPADGDDACLLIDQADAAMYRAKRQGIGSFFFHGDATPVDRSPAASIQSAARRPPTAAEMALAEYAQRHSRLQEANEHLVLAALNAQQLLVSKERVHQRQTQLLAVVAHELRNPLAPLRNAASMLGRAHVNEQLLRRVQAVIERQVTHMTRLVGDLLDVSRVHTGKLRLERRTVDMASVISDAVDACRPAMNMRLQHFSMDAPACQLDVDCDPVRLVQIVSNLLDNASKYTPHGGAVDLSIAVDDDSLTLTVSDNGIGITPQALASVFDPFVQDAHAVGFNGAGLGLGLTVVRELIEAHGGSVVASSQGKGLGSQFTVRLPLRSGPVPFVPFVPGESTSDGPPLPRP